MAETMAPALGELFAPRLEDSRWTGFIPMLQTKDDSAVVFAGNKAVTFFPMRKNKDDSAVEFAWNKAEVAGSGLQKSASWSDFDTKPAGNKAASASSIEAAAKAEGKAKQAAVKVESKAKQAADKVEGKAKQTAVSTFEPAARAEGKAKQAPGNGIKLLRATVPVNYMEIVMARVAGPEPKVVEVKTEMVPEDCILSLKKKPLRRPTPTVFPEHYYKRFPEIRESVQTSLAMINSLIDVKENILRQYEEKGHAVVGIRVMDNGMRRWFILPEEATA